MKMGKLREKIDKAIKLIREINGPIIVSLSGGVDSSVVTALAKEALGKDNVIAVTAISPNVVNEEVEWAKKITESLKVKHIIVEYITLEDQNFVNNPPNRCYFCKLNMYGKLSEIKEKIGAKAILDGLNASDLSGHRPGFLANKRYGIISPLAEVGITKDEVREIAKIYGLPNWNKPSEACLASRIPYGEKITIEKLMRIYNAEKLIKDITGVRVVRVRDHGNLARIEIDKSEIHKILDTKIMEIIDKKLHELGYLYVTLDLSGYRSGSMDEVLNKKITPLEFK